MASPWDTSFADEGEAPGSDFRATTKDALILLIDARKSMFETNEKGEVYLQNACQAAVTLMKTQIIASTRDLVGVWFYGTAEKKNSNSFEGVFEFVELAACQASSIKLMESVASGEYDFEGNVGSRDADDASPLDHALWAASMSLSSKVKDTDSQRIWLFTNDDNPNASDPALRASIVQKGKDLADMAQDLTLWYMSTPAHEFNPRTFFAQMIPVDEDGESGMNDVSNLEDVVQSVRRKEYRKRAYARIPWILADGIELSVGIYNMIYEAKKPSAVQLETATNQPLKIETNWVCADTGKQLMPHEITTYHKFGTSKVLFDKADMKEIKNFGEPSLRLMGFKPKDTLSPLVNMRSPYFLYPNEAGVTGSTTAFRALQEKMIEMGKVAIVRMIMRSGSAPRFCALLPQKEVLNEDGWTESPTGMFMIPLPFAEDVRSLVAEKFQSALPEQIALAKKMVQALNAPNFSCYNFDNPVLQKHYAAVQALALTEDQADWTEEDDLVNPDEEGMKKYKALVDDFREAFGGDSEPAASGKKRRTPAASSSRKRAAPSGGRPTKRARGEAKVEEDGDGPDVPGLARKGQLKKLKVAELKAYLKSQGLKVGGRKADLIEAIEEHLNIME